MWKVDVYEQPLGPAQPAAKVKEWPDPFPSRHAAKEAITSYMNGQRYEASGYDPKQDYDWARKKGDEKNTIFVIRPVPPPA